MYGLTHIKQDVHDHDPSYKQILGPFESTFKTFVAAHEYPSIGSFDVGKQLIDLSFCRRDILLATVESTNEDFTQTWTGGSVVKVYMVGRTKSGRGDDADDDDDEDDEDDEDNSDKDDDDDDMGMGDLENELFTDNSQEDEDDEEEEEELDEEGEDEEDVEEEGDEDSEEDEGERLAFSMLTDSEDDTQGVLVE